MYFLTKQKIKLIFKVLKVVQMLNLEVRINKNCQKFNDSKGYKWHLQNIQVVNTMFAWTIRLSKKHRHS